MQSVMDNSSLIPDETGFDLKLMQIAGEIADQTLRGSYGIFGREADVRSVFRAMQAHAAASRLADSPEALGSCRIVGRAMAEAKRVAGQ